MNDSSLIGCTKDDLDTPAMCIDLDILRSNIDHMASLCRQHNVAWRPHSKCHKSSTIARWQVDSGALGVTCAKVGEAEVMAAGGIQDILIANMIVGEQKLRRLVEVRKQADPIVCVDCLEQAEPMSAAMEAAGLKIRVILEVDIGLERVGVAPGEATVALAQQVARLPGLELAGIMGYEGHTLAIADMDEKIRKVHEALDILVDCARQIEAAGIPCPIVSCGGTGSYYISVEHPGITEVQAGGGIFMDALYRHILQVPDLEYAVTVLTSIVSRPTTDRAIVDAGRKTLNQELHIPLVHGRDDITVEALSAEHGRLKLDESAQDLRVGDRLELTPGYVDFTSVLHDDFYCFRDGRLESILPIEGRGKIR